MTSLAFAALLALAAPQTTPPDEPAPAPQPPAQPKKPRKSPPRAPPPVKQDAVVAPLDVERLMASLQSVPATSAERVAKLVELMKSGAGDAGQVDVVPLGESLMARAPKLNDELRDRLAKRKVSAAEGNAALAALNRRLQALDGNVVAKLPGRTERVIVVAAHLDASPGSAGIVDDWAGCALLAELLSSCRDAAFRHALWFVAFAKEEDGCLGSAAFADQLTPAQCEAIDAVVTVECAGVSTPQVWWSGSDRGLVELASDVALAAGQNLPVVDYPGGKSDGRRLKGKNVPVVTLLGVEPARFKMLHGPEDRVEAVERGHLVEMRNLVAGLLQACDLTAQPLRWDYVSEKLRIGDEPGMRKALQPVKVDLAAVVAPVPAPAAPSSPRDGSHRP